MAGLLAGTAYALLSGFSVPAQRTTYMLASLAMSQLLSLSITPSQLLASALIPVLLIDPWSVISPGFWLSFSAVALIFYITANRLGRSHRLLEYGRVQWAMTIGLAAPLLALFQQVSLVSPFANAIAIPMISLIVVPLALLAVVVPLDFILMLAHKALEICMTFLTWLNQLPEPVWRQHEPPDWSIILGMLGALWCLLPGCIPSRWLGLLLMLPMFLVLPAPPTAGTLRMVILDVGQGLAVLVQTHDHTLLYDAGPDYPGTSDSGSRIALPLLRSRGISHLDSLVLSHHDIDHIGGANSILGSVEVDRVISSFSRNEYEDGANTLPSQTGWQRCVDGQRWEWDGIRFEILHPALSSYASADISDNNRGCVLRISDGNTHILLAADIEKDSESRLLLWHADKLPADLLIVPHHGSNTSSIVDFVRAVHPQYAVFTVGYRNRFGHPRTNVVQCYRDIASQLLRSDEDGAVLVEMDPDGLKVDSYRKSHHRYWQQ